MNDQPRFDESRSAAIRSMLVSTVAAAPQRDHRRHLRIAVISVIAALLAGIGSAGVAVALTGTDLFGAPAPAPVVTETATAAAPPPASPTPTAPAPTATPHPLVVTGDPITPHDVLTQPATTPKWSLQLPGAGDLCQLPSVVDVSDGYALVQTGPTRPPEDSPFDCDLSESRYSVSLVDTSTGTAVWSRDWSWTYDTTPMTEATLLGTSGRVLVWSRLGQGPKEVLDIATGTTVGTVTVPAGYTVDSLNPVPGDSGDVSYLVRNLDAAGQPTASWAILRADPRDLGSPRWSVPFQAGWAHSPEITNDSSIVQVQHSTPDFSKSVTDVYDVDSGAVMVSGAEGRSYTYFDGFTVRGEDLVASGGYRTVAGIDDEGNEIWRRTLDAGNRVAPVRSDASAAGAPAGTGVFADLLLMGPGNALELVDGATGATRWTADGSICITRPTDNLQVYSFWTTADGIIAAFSDAGGLCGFDRATGAVVDVSSRVSPWGAGASGALARYRIEGGLWWGSSSTEQQDPSSVPPATATALDAATGATLWSLPIADDERWQFAGGYLVGFSGGRMFGIG